MRLEYFRSQGVSMERTSWGAPRCYLPSRGARRKPPPVGATPTIRGSLSSAADRVFSQSYSSEADGSISEVWSVFARRAIPSAAACPPLAAELRSPRRDGPVDEKLYQDANLVGRENAIFFLPAIKP